MQSEGQLREWQARLRAWEVETTAELEKCASKIEVSTFRVLDTYPPRVFHGVTNERSSDFFHRTVFLGFQEDAVGIRLRDVIGVDNMMLGLRLSPQRVDVPAVAEDPRRDPGRRPRGGAGQGRGQEHRPARWPGIAP